MFNLRGAICGLPSLISNVVSRTFTTHKRIKIIPGLQSPVRIYKPGEEDLRNLPDDEAREWKEQKSLYKLAQREYKPRKIRRNPLGDAPQMRGIVLKTLIKKPKKPNSANRKCVYIRLTNGKEVTAFVPGVGHNLQEHSNVLVKLHRVSDVPGLRLRVIRGVYDCSLPIKRPLG